MKKLLNDPDDYADPALEGLCLADPETYTRAFETCGERSTVVNRRTDR
ncbi:MAG TPA: hypothetical protein QGF50_06140 [Roseibacillus sp.]|jgi:hypothetical protein|nr:hypothetical protein [Roseibacillus sp.]